MNLRQRLKLPKTLSPKVRKALMLFVAGAVLAWVGAYGPGLWNHQEMKTALNETSPHWLCLINADTVYSENRVYVTKKYILLNGRRFYSDEFKHFGRDGSFILMVIDNDQSVKWSRLTHHQATAFSAHYGFTQTGCRYTNTGATMISTAPGETYRNPRNYNFNYKFRDNSSRSPEEFWEKAVGPALRPVRKSKQP